MKSSYLVCYDITSPKRLNKVFRFLRGRGVHLQYSVFHCILAWPQLKELKDRIGGMIDPSCDDVRIYPLPAGEKADVLGVADRVPEGVEVHL